MLLTFTAFAQLEVKEGSFKEVPGFININTEKMYDDNDKPYAVLKIKTENINDKQRHELYFQGDAATFFEIEYKVGEVWAYLSYYATYIKISHPDLSSTEYHFPYDMSPKCGYELILVNKSVPILRDITKDCKYAIRVGDECEELYIDNQYISLYPLDEKLAHDYSISRNYEDSINSFRILAYEGDPVAQNNLGACYYEGKGVEQNYDTAVKWFKASAEQDNAIGQINLSLCYFRGTGIVKDSIESLRLCQKSINQGIAGAENLFGSLFCDDKETSFLWWMKAADDNCPSAQHNISRYYYEKKDYPEAVRWCEKAVEQGFVASKSLLGFFYYYGNGVPENKPKAVKLFKEAADKGYVIAQNNLGIYYLNEEKNYNEAFKWFKIAADNDYAPSQVSLGDCYKLGRGITQDPHEAFIWYYRAAINNNILGQYNVGYCYENGIGVVKDKQKAIKWYKLSAAQGHEPSKKALKRLRVK